MTGRLKWPLSYALAVLAVSYAFTAYVLFVPGQLKNFNTIMFLPASIAVCWRLAQNRNLRNLLEPIKSAKIFKAGAFALVYPIAVILVCALIAQVTGLATIEWRNLPSAVHLFTLGQFAWAMGLIFGEEYGWRGYLLPELNKILGPVKSTAVVGLVWAAWHGPLVHGLASRLGTAQSPLLLTIVQMSVVFLFSFPFAYVYFLSGSVIPSMIFHFVWNWLNPEILGNLYRNLPGLAHGDIFVINGEGMLGAVVAVGFCVWYLRKFWRVHVAAVDVAP